MPVRSKVRGALERLGLHTPEREECVMALLDDVEPSPFRALAQVGLAFSSGASTQQIFGVIAPLLGKTSIDREARDQIMLPLREIGVLGIAYADTKARQVEIAYWKPKSPNNVYLVEAEFRSLVESDDATFDENLDRWMSSSDERLARLATAEGAAAAAHEGERLVRQTIETYCSVGFPGHQVVFVDDEDARDRTDWTASIRKFELPLDLSTRWPDIILRDPESGHFWIIDCVESDGELDTVRKSEIEASFDARGHAIDGYTTVYRTVTRFAQRQRSTDNIAYGTYVWIMELGGAHWRKERLG